MASVCASSVYLMVDLFYNDQSVMAFLFPQILAMIFDRLAEEDRLARHVAVRREAALQPA